MTLTESRILQVRLGNMSLGEFDNWLAAYKEEGYQEGYNDAQSASYDWEDGYEEGLADGKRFNK